MSLETTVACSSRRWGDDEEAEGQSSDAAPIALHGHRPVPRDGSDGKEEAAEGRGGEGGEWRVAGQLPERTLGEENARIFSDSCVFII